MGVKNWSRRETLPTNLSHYTPECRRGISGDFYVSPDGRECAVGSENDPFPSVEAALAAARKYHEANHGKQAVIVLLDGCYQAYDTLRLTKEDSFTTVTVQNDGRVKVSGGMTFDSSEFVPVGADERKMFDTAAADFIYRIDMKKAGLQPSDWSRIYAAGNVVREGDPELWQGKRCEIFCNGRRMTLPRYPDEGFIGIEKVVDAEHKVDVVEVSTPGIYVTEDSGSGSYKGCGGTFGLSPDTVSEIRTWKRYDNLWVEGYFSVDFSGSLLPVENIDLEKGELTTALSDAYGLAVGGYYYFVNVPRKLSRPGQYYIDYDNGILYVYPECDIKDAVIQLSVLDRPFIEADGVTDITIDGIDFLLSKDSAVRMSGDRILIRKCSFTDIYETAVTVTGIRNTISECEFAHLAKSGATLTGGDRPTLTPGYAVFDNNVVHDYGEVDKTGVHAVSIVGVHNRVSHNEFYNSPFTVIHYSGQDHLIEYNYAHEVVQNTGDMGTTYSGFHWDSQGCVLRYNCFCNIGNERFGSNGIYWDDMLGGQTGYGNIIINAAGHAFIIGGGRDHLNYNNIVVNCGGFPILYDQRGCEWEKEFALNTDSGIWANLKSEPFRNEQWTKKFPALARITEEPDFDNPDFPPVPANSRITGNVYISTEKPLVMDKVRRFSIFGNNVELNLDDDAGFVDREGGNYTFRDDSVIFDMLPAFENLPFGKMGRY